MKAGAAQTRDKLGDAPIDYLDPRLPAGLEQVSMPIVAATPEALEGYGRLVDDPRECRVEIGNCSFRSIAGRSTCLWRCRATM